jgi:multidrug efflux pump subunit AcrA (membrane-fusion protein)
MYPKRFLPKTFGRAFILFNLILAAASLTLRPATSRALPKKTPMVVTQTAKSAEIFDQITYPARIDSKVNAKIIADSDGVVLKILSPLGHRIGRGNGVLVIKNMEVGYQYAPMTILAPVSGVVSQVKVTVGSQVVKGQEVALITDPSAIKVVTEIAAPDLFAFQKNLSGELHVSGLTEPVPVKLAGVSPFVDPATGTATAELRILSAKPGIVPGLVGQVRFKVNKHQGIALPDHAIVYKGAETQVRVVREGKAKYLKVKIGRKRQGLVEVLEGLKAGEHVIERTSTYVADGDAVQTQPEQRQKPQEQKSQAEAK